MSHSPGPWRYNPYNEAVYDDGDDDTEVCRFAVSNAAQEANAALIADAPELLRHLHAAFMAGYQHPAVEELLAKHGRL